MVLDLNRHMLKPCLQKICHQSSGDGRAALLLCEPQRENRTTTGTRGGAVKNAEVKNGYVH